MVYRKSAIFVLLLAICLVFAYCGINSDPAENPAEFYVTHTVTFMVGQNVYSTQTVKEGECAAALVPQISGLQFQSWMNESGEPVQPESTPVNGNVTYTAMGYPDLTSHAPFLFTDGEGKLNPDLILTADDVSRAFDALAAEGAKTYFPSMPAGSDAIRPDTLSVLLNRFFPQNDVTEAMSNADEGSLSRSDFAVILCRLLGRTGETNIVISADVTVPADITGDTAHWEDLLEASVLHTEGEYGIAWKAYDPFTKYEPGFFFQNGRLYFADEDGYLLRDGTVGLLNFGPDGRYTSGDGELDAQVDGILAQIIAENPDMDRIELLYQAHIYCRDSFKYLRKEAFGIGQTGWEIDCAKVMFTGGRGNCYNYAATFWALARGLGYDARAVSGVVLSDRQPHGWVFIELDGEDYIFDCEWEMAYRTQHNPPRYDMDMFMIPRSDWSYWSYEW